jgi:predicted helicase
MPRIFPDMAAENRVICVSGIGARSGFSALMADTLPCLDNIEKGQCFPLYLYDPVVPAQAGTQATLDLAEAKPLDSRPTPSRGLAPRGNDGYMRGNDGYARRDAITNEGLAHFQSTYPGETISKEDVFYYVYGLLHSKDYRERYADNLAKELPRIPRVQTAADFWAFSQAGRKLAELHLNYETVPIYQGAKVLGTDGKVFNLGDPQPLDSRLRGNDDDGRGNDEREGFWRVEKMKVPKTDGKKDLTRLIYNAHITVSGIPPEAYDYIVNGKPALDWVVERQCVKTDKGQRHCQRRQRLGHRNDRQSALSAGIVPARYHREPGDDEDRQRPAATGNRQRLRQPLFSPSFPRRRESSRGSASGASGSPPSRG